MRLTRLRNSERGVAMLLALMAMLLVAGIATLMFARTLNEIRHSGDDTAIVQTLMLARGGANIGSGLLAMDIHHEFRDIVERTTTPGRWAYGDDTAGFSDEGPVPASVVREMTPAINMLQDAADDIVCGRNVMPESGMGEVRLRIHFTESACDQELPSSVTLPSPRFVQGPPRLGPAGIQEYAIPFAMVSEASLNDYSRNIVMQGEYRFEIGQASFAQYAYFTNRDSNTSNQIWFTENTMIDGPVHTNGNFAFYQDPWFGGRVTSVGCTSFGVGTCTSSVSPGAFFYDRPSTRVSVGAMQPNSNNPRRGNHAPRFEDSVTWDAQFVPLPENAFDQRAVAISEHEETLTRGLFYDTDLISLEMWAGNPSGVRMNRSGQTWSPPSTHQYIEACYMGTVENRTWVEPRRIWIPIIGWITLEPGYWDIEETIEEVCELWRHDSAGILQRLDPESDRNNPSSWTWTTADKPFNGVVYVEGEIERFRGPERLNWTDGQSAPPAIARFAQITVVAEEDIRLTRDLRYEQPPCTGVPVRNTRNRTVTPATCDNLNHANVLGVYTPGGDVVIGNDHSGSGSADLNAPDNMHVHAVLMSAENQIRVEGHQERGSYQSDRGQFYLLGGMIQENRGVFGTFGSGGRKGYDRVYTYDPRMRRGITPPYFPTTGLDEVQAVRHFSFGQREQVY